MAGSRFLLRARVSSSNARAIRPVLEKLSTKGTVKEVGGEFEIEAWMEGPSARELNRSLLSALRREEKRTRLRAEWTSEEGTTEKYFDYVLKRTTKA